MSTPTPPPAPATPVPTVCPFCRSLQVATTSKTAGESDYWRCHSCGQIWNPSRMERPRGWR